MRNEMIVDKTDAFAIDKWQVTDDVTHAQYKWPYKKQKWPDRTFIRENMWFCPSTLIALLLWTENLFNNNTKVCACYLSMVVNIFRNIFLQKDSRAIKPKLSVWYAVTDARCVFRKLDKRQELGMFKGKYVLLAKL